MCARVLFTILFQDLVEVAGPEEMKWSQKELYTYNVHNGDKFIVDEKVPLGRIRTSSRSSLSSSYGASSLSPKINVESQRNAISFQLTPKPNFGMARSPGGRSGPARNLFGGGRSPSGGGPRKQPARGTGSSGNNKEE